MKEAINTWGRGFTTWELLEQGVNCQHGHTKLCIPTQHTSTHREVLITILRLIAPPAPQSESEQGHVVDVAWLAALVGEMEVFLKHHSSLN